MTIKPSDEAIAYVCALDLNVAQDAVHAIYAEIEEFYPGTLTGLFLCKTEFDRNQSHAVRIWKAFMTEYIKRRIAR
jgi:hypothetical protein